MPPPRRVMARPRDEASEKTELAEQGHHRRLGEVEPNLGRDARQFEEEGDEVGAVVVVVQVAVGEPGIVRWELRAAEGGVEVSELHGLLAAPDRMPPVRIDEPECEEHREDGPEHSFAPNHGRRRRRPPSEPWRAMSRRALPGDPAKHADQG
jgi:hypothetical protein